MAGSCQLCQRPRSAGGHRVTNGRYGYNVYWQVLNAKHYGIPQNRERVYCVIIRKDLDNGKFKFPSPIPLKKALVDMLEDKVDERYYLPDDKVAAMITPPVQTNQ